MVRKTNYENIYTEIKSLKRKIKKIMPSVNESVESIIHDNITSSIAIEQVLDQLLDYASLGFGEQEFKRLNRYYTTTNKENAAFYEREFNKL